MGRGEGGMAGWVALIYYFPNIGNPGINEAGRPHGCFLIEEQVPFPVLLQVELGTKIGRFSYDCENIC